MAAVLGHRGRDEGRWDAVQLPIGKRVHGGGGRDGGQTAGRESMNGVVLGTAR